MVLVIGVGNPTRRDDGAGIEIIRRLETLALSGVELQSSTQLDPSLSIDLVAYEKVLVVDADPNATTVVIEPAPAETGIPSTHHFTPSALRDLAASIHGKTPEMWVCRIPASDFEFGEAFSSATGLAIEEAVEKIALFISADKNKKYRK
jgi:hydrogenase maturation protease